jgi:hypothetical protein
VASHYARRLLQIWYLLVELLGIFAMWSAAKNSGVSKHNTRPIAVTEELDRDGDGDDGTATFLRRAYQVLDHLPQLLAAHVP